MEFRHDPLEFCLNQAVRRSHAGGRMEKREGGTNKIFYSGCTYCSTPVRSSSSFWRRWERLIGIRKVSGFQGCMPSVLYWVLCQGTEDTGQKIYEEFYMHEYIDCQDNIHATLSSTALFICSSLTPITFLTVWLTFRHLTRTTPSSGSWFSSCFLAQQKSLHPVALPLRVFVSALTAQEYKTDLVFSRGWEYSLFIKAKR